MSGPQTDSMLAATPGKASTSSRLLSRFERKACRSACSSYPIRALSVLEIAHAFGTAEVHGASQFLRAAVDLAECAVLESVKSGPEVSRFFGTPH